MRLCTVHIGDCVCEIIPSARVPADRVAKSIQLAATELFQLTGCLQMIHSCIQARIAEYVWHVCEKCKANYFSMVVRTLLGRLFRKAQRLVSIVAVSCAAGVRNGTVLVMFEKLFVIIDNTVLPLLDSKVGRECQY